ncbi:MAG: AraC family transcriptional regulator ligand-binding domain-containing protein [Halioglobus sp.]|nr:AraC family transcriptional regulator ligand-binding domain-containing protein [Halioglobus sp.]MCP5121502.1 AraC family transcriptional regulator ligand-binding domain-containing protein [Pseudomonadales bacterium]MCP5193156.1 AraC family transcriptional regulator ligand-binding domain-containing protein [Pseudomonadales bacterium]
MSGAVATADTEAAHGRGFVYTRALPGLMDLAAALGADRGLIARSAGVDPVQLALPDAVISRDCYYRLLAECQRQTGNPDFGLLSGRVSYMGSTHLFLYLASTSKTLRDWLNMLPSVTSLVGDVGSVQVSRHREGFALEWHPVRPPGPGRCMITDNILATTVLQMDSYCMLPVRPRRVDLSYAQPGDISGLRERLGGPLHFDQPVSAIHYDWDVLDYPQVHVVTRAYDAVVEEFSAFFSANASAADPLSLELHAAIRRQLPVGKCSIDSVAADMGVSRRTLQRRLKERDTNFQQLLQGVKSNLARRYLEDKSLSIIEIAFLLGYGDPSSFSAAFKAWGGLTPTEFRRQ